MKSMKTGLHFTFASLMLLGSAYGQALLPIQTSLQNHTWTLTSLAKTNGTTQSVSGNKYTIEFKSGGEAGIKADCNGCGATYTTSSATNATSGALSLSVGMCSKMYCGAASLDNQFLAQLALVKSWESNVSTLFLKNTDKKTILTLTNGIAVDPIPASTPPNGFYQDWNLIRIGLANKTRLQLDKNRFLKFKKDGTASYQTDCNTCSSEFGASASKLKIGMGLCTMMACTEVDLASPYLYSLIRSEDSLSYQLKGNELWIFLNNDKDTLIYHNIQTLKVSQESKFGQNALVNWSASSNAGILSFSFTEVQDRVTVSAYSLRGVKLVTSTSIFKNHLQLNYTFMPGRYLIELDLNGHKQHKTLTLK